MMNLIDVDRYRVGPMSSHRNLALFPLMADQTPRSAYLLLDEALASGKVHISETSSSGTVRELLLVNEADLPVLLVDGEEVLGIKQNRIINMTILAPAKSTTVIPVSCTEAGRWRRHTELVSGTENIFFAKGRARKASRVSQSLMSAGRADGRQDEVWSGIAHKLACLGVSSPTGAMSDAFDDASDRLIQFEREIALPSDAAGAVYAINGQLAGLELFEAPEIFVRLAKRVIRSWALDAIESDERVNRPFPSKEMVTRFLLTTAASPTERVTAPGIGTSIRFAGGDLVGGALVHFDRTLCLLAFSKTFAEAP